MINSNLNILIHGDNIKALKKLNKDYKDCIKLAYLDPPYCSNTSNEHYSDKFDLKDYKKYIMKVIKLILPLLTEDGFLIFQINSENSFISKLIIDKIFKKENYRGQIIVSKDDCKIYDKKRHWLISGYDCLLVYSKNSKGNIPPLIEKTENNTVGQWASFYTSTVNIENQYSIFNKNIKEGAWRKDKKWADQAIQNYKDLLIFMEKEKIKEEEIEYGIKKYIENKNIKDISLLRYMNNRVEYYIPTNNTIHITDNWSDIDIRGYETDFEHEVSEKLLQRILKWITKENDIILDPFLGSGTSAIVASKLNRKWIGIEKEEYCKKNIITRIKDEKNEVNYYEL